MKKIVFVFAIFVFSINAMDQSTIKKWALAATSVTIKCGSERTPLAINDETTVAHIKAKIWQLSNLPTSQQNIVAYHRDPKTFWLMYTYSRELPDIANVKQVMSSFNTDTLALLFKF